MVSLKNTYLDVSIAGFSDAAGTDAGFLQLPRISLSSAELGFPFFLM